ncbi:hydantoin racemase [Pseudorhodoferax aquiterrae]|uniref:Hydantoin racemase n=1 Tax=Pseudorhodoferax aquiterrae TaxID=747304 RepID=A0ABQ3GE77_9BURK|nr:aspartate/glutamate racemase family protein [Pseudorhodoferax aquiterrae]GHD02870.1 hydantoin racemase [Pseudorhodoferax aquiterrae]
MARKVLLINPNTSAATTAMMAELARAALPPALALCSATAARGAPMITSDAELATAVDEVLAIGVREAPGVAAIVVAAFGDPALALLRARVAVPVVGIGEASMQEAAAGGRRFGVATTTPGLAESIAQAVARLGLSAQFSGTRIPKDDPLRLAADPGLQDRLLGQAVRTCIEQDGAQAVVIGGGPLAQSAARLAGQFGVPVVSPVAAAMRRVAALL